MAFSNFNYDPNDVDVSHWEAGGNVWSGNQIYNQNQPGRWRTMGDYMGDLSGQTFFNQPGPFTGVGPRNYRPSDSYILDEIVRRLTWAGHLNARDIVVNVVDGEVTLTGSVDSRQQKRMAENIADGVAGVVDIFNELKINRPGQPGQGQQAQPQQAQNKQGEKRAEKQSQKRQSRSRKQQSAS